jgi:nucleoside-diphosphate-sugar epimerase
MRRIAVTGAAGRIGRYVVQELLGHGYEVVAVDRRLPQEHAHRRLEVDLTDLGQVCGALEDVDAIVHLGAIPSPTVHPPEVVFQNNVVSTYNVLEAAAIRGIRKVATASSVSAYGMPYARDRLAPRYLPVDEEHPLLAGDCYALSKQVGEETCAMFHRRHGLQAVSLRFGRVVGADDYGRFFEVPPDQLRRELWSYVDGRDAAVACRLAVERDGLAAEAYLINAPDSCSRIPTAELIREHWPEATCRGDLSGHQALYDISKAQRLLGWEPQHLWRTYIR